MSRAGDGAISIESEVDPKSFADLKRTLGPVLYEKAVKNLWIDATHVAEAVAKDVTPAPPAPANATWKRTGHARRATQADTSAHAVMARYPYFNWLDKGKDSRGREMKVKPGGYQITRQARERTLAALPKLMDKCGREIVARWQA